MRLLKYLSFLPLVLFSTSACVSTKETAYKPDQTNLSVFEREVQYELSRDFWTQAPRCVTILPISTSQKGGADNSQIENAFGRYLFGKVERVISPQMRDRKTRTLALDLNYPVDRKYWAKATNCPYFMKLTPLDDQGNYALFWSRKAVGVEAILIDASENQSLWKARHVADRFNGGLPLSPFDAALSLFKANSLTFDQDVNASLADDLARRILATLPSITG
ncbi:MAG: hypothetical protein R3261_05305 [Alphaproteobacteria bacterium]|nr:hypothetical protein [Alphaproteobacteria bacterium]